MRRTTFLLFALLCCAPVTAEAADQYSLANGCWNVGDQSSLRLKPAALGKYLLYTADGKFVTPSGAIAKVDGNAIWTADADGQGFTGAGGARLEGPVAEGTGCAEFPEAEQNSTGTPKKGASPMGDVQGVIDQHAHLMAFDFLGGNFHCGKPWSPLGVTVALPDCASIQGPNGTAAPVQNFVDFGDPVHPHDTVGWPTFKDWPTHEKLSYEQTYWRWVERAWLGGVRMIQTNMVENEVLCRLVPGRFTSCNDMDAVERQIQALYGFQDYIDAQYGGPGKGFFRIVTSPYQARKVINQGKMAVVMGIELSRIFGCGIVQATGAPQCTKDGVDAGVAKARKQGIRVFYPVHKFDNAFGGTKMDGGALGVLINVANQSETGHYWAIKTCTTPDGEDREQLTAPPAGPFSDLIGGVKDQLGVTSTLPIYPAGPHCNQQGLTELGEYVLRKMVQNKFIIEIDHMSGVTADESLSVIEDEKYPGVIASHNWSNEKLDNPRIRNLGGVVASGSKNSTAFVESWKQDRSIRSKAFRYGIGFGADTNGLAEQGGPRTASDKPALVYPFKSHDGRVTFDKQTTGQQTYDINEDGVAHYGLYADWLEDIRIVGGPKVIRDMFNSSETYLEMWERAEGAQGLTRPTGKVTARGYGKLKLGTPWKRVLKRVGQPATRPGTAYRYRGGAGAFFRGGKVVLAGKRAKGKVKLQGRYVLRGGKRVAVTSLRGPAKVKKALKAAGL